MGQIGAPGKPRCAVRCRAPGKRRNTAPGELSGAPIWPVKWDLSVSPDIKEKTAPRYGAVSVSNQCGSSVFRGFRVQLRVILDADGLDQVELGFDEVDMVFLVL